MANPQTFDYIIVGAGSAGCVMANKLSANSINRVLLIEAGPADKSFLIHMPKGIGKLLTDPNHVWKYPIEASGDLTPESWPRGKTLGGGSSVNGMMYNRGQPEDYDALESEHGCTGWNWSSVLPYFRAMEDHELGANDWRGSGGPLRVTMPTGGDPLYERMIEAGVKLGLKRVDDVNGPNGKGVIGYFPRTIAGGSRQSSAKAFLSPVRNRPNLTVLTGTLTHKILFEGQRAIGVRCTGPVPGDYLARREVVLCAGSVATPHLLQVSGIGDPEHLQSIGVPVVHASPEVGGNAIEHRCLQIQFRINANISHNRQFQGWRLFKNVMQYLFTKSGCMSDGAYELGAFIRTDSNASRPDAQLLMAPWSIDHNKLPLGMEKEPGIGVLGYILRPKSRGYLQARSADINETPKIQPNYLTHEYDQNIAINIVHFIRKYAKQTGLVEVLVNESSPGTEYKSDADVLKAWAKYGACGNHLVGTCRMGSDANSVVDPELRVRGVSGLSVMDCSIVPFMVAGNTNGPMMAMAGRAADLVLSRHAGAH